MTQPGTKVLLVAPRGPFLNPAALLYRDRLARRLNGLFSRSNQAAASGTLVDGVNRSPPNPTAFHKQTEQMSRDAFLAIFYLGPVIRDDNDVFIFTENSKPSKTRSLIRLTELFKDIKQLSYVVAEDPEDDTGCLHIKSRFETKTYGVKESWPNERLNCNFLDSYLDFYPYIPGLTISNLVNLYLFKSKQHTCESQPVHISEFRCSPDGLSRSPVMSALSHNLMSTNAGSREDGINDLLYFRARHATSDEANALIAFFAACDPDKEVRCAAERVKHLPEVSRVRTLAPRFVRLPGSFLEDFCAIPAGSFRMGSDPRNDAHSLPEERPEHKVYLEDFKIARTPVTVSDWFRFKQDTTPRFSQDSGLRRNAPMTHVSWYDALEYCTWLTLAAKAEGFLSDEEEITLPSEAQWEKAARGVDARIYPWGNKFEPTYANYRDNGPLSPIDVASFSPLADSPYGVTDMAGNIWEWTRSLWGRNGASPEFFYPYCPDDGRENIDAPGDVRRVVRGGAWYYFDYCLRCSTRNLMYPHVVHSGGGFRTTIQRKQKYR